MACWSIWDDTSPETTAFALKLLIRQDRGSGLMPKAARWLAEHRDGDYWYSTKQTSMVIQGLTDYLALSGELANSSDVEVLVNGASVGKHHFGPDDAFAAPWQVKIPAAQAAGGGQLTIRKSGNGITYWSAESSWYSADRKSFQQGQLALNITRDYYLLQKKQDKPTDPITYDLVPLKGPVHIGDIVAVKLALSGTDWKYLLAEDPIPAGTEFLPETGLYTLNNKPDWWADWFTRKEFHDDRAAFFNTDFSTAQRVRLPAQGGQPRHVPDQPGTGRTHVPIERPDHHRSRNAGGAAVNDVAAISTLNDLFRRLRLSLRMGCGPVLGYAAARSCGSGVDTPARQLRLAGGIDAAAAAGAACRGVAARVWNHAQAAQRWSRGARRWQWAR